MANEFTQDLVRRELAANQKLPEEVLALMRPDVKWANGMEGGWVHGHDAVRAYWTRQWGLIDPHVEPTASLIDSPDARASTM